MNDTQNPRKPKIKTFEEIFFGLEANTLPNFDWLHNKIGLPSNGGGGLLTQESREAIDSQLRPIHTICRQLKFTPLLSEFSLITDTRLIGPKAAPFFSSFITIFVKPAADVAAAYSQALRFMSTPEAGAVQIVPHRDLYSPHVALIDFECSALYDRQDRQGLACDVSENPVLTSGLRQGFELIDHPDFGLVSQVEKFIAKFFSHLQSDAKVAAAASEFGRSLFLLLPFVRPNFGSAALPLPGTQSRDELRGYPGGALFLFLKRESTNSSAVTQALELRDLIRALSWLLAEASLRESYASFDLEESRRRTSTSYSVTHPLKHRLGALDADTRWLSESYDAQAPDFGQRLGVHRQLVKTVYGFAELCHVLHYAMVNGPSETFEADDAIDGLKFSTTTTLDIAEVLKLTSQNQALSSNVSKQLKLAFPEQFAPTLDGFHPVGDVGLVRLKDNIYIEVINEIVSNILRHALEHENIVRAQVELEEVNGALAIVITNELSEFARKRINKPSDDWTKWHSESPTGLSFVADTLRLTNAGALYIKHPRVSESGDRCFSVALALRGLHADSLMSV